MHTVDEMHGFQDIRCHVIFEVKTIFVVNGSKTEAPVTLTYSIVVSRDSVRLALFIAALNGLGVMTCSIGKCISQCIMQREKIV